MKVKTLNEENYKKDFDKNDLIREFQLEHNRSENCFDRIYKILQFTFAAIIAIAVFAFNDQAVQNNTKFFMLSYVLPAVLYVFGIMFTHSAYSLSVCGKRAITIRKAIYNLKENALEGKYTLNNVLYNYVSADRRIAFVAYGAVLAFYLLLPLFSILICFTDEVYPKNYSCLLFISFMILGIYYIFMIIIIVGLIKNFSIKD